MINPLGLPWQSQWPRVDVYLLLFPEAMSGAKFNVYLLKNKNCFLFLVGWIFFFVLFLVVFRCVFVVFVFVVGFGGGVAVSLAQFMYVQHPQWWNDHICVGHRFHTLGLMLSNLSTHGSIPKYHHHHENFTTQIPTWISVCAIETPLENPLKELLITRQNSSYWLYGLLSANEGAYCRYSSHIRRSQKETVHNDQPEWLKPFDRPQTQQPVMRSLFRLFALDPRQIEMKGSKSMVHPRVFRGHEDVLAAVTIDMQKRL